MYGESGKQPPQVRIGCTDLAGQQHHLFVFNDPRGLVVVFPPGEWAVLARGQLEQLRTALGFLSRRQRAQSFAGQFACFGDDGKEYVWTAVGLDRQRWLNLMLTAAELPAQARVLEIATDPDFGYSATVLADATDGGSVVSVSEHARETDRAHRAQRFARRARRISFRTGPLSEGWPHGAPYDLIMALFPFGWLPDAWLAQCRPGGTVVQPLYLGERNRTVFLHVEVDEQHQPGQYYALELVNPDPRYPPQVVFAPTVELHHNPGQGGYEIRLGLWPYEVLPPHD